MNWLNRIIYRPFFVRLMHWEYWPFNAVYIWLYPVWLYYCLRARSLFFFSASNPGFENGGFLMESKKKIYDSMPRDLYPKTILALPTDSDEEIIAKVKAEEISFPLIAKPDIGGRGRGVKKIDCASDLIDYLRKFPFAMLVQEWVDYHQEIGIFYYRYPGQPQGRISGIVGKKFLLLKGDGISTMEGLLKKNKRYILQLPALQESMQGQLQEILRVNEERILVPYGNHARGALFLDNSAWIDEELEKTIDIICQRVPGYYFGRLDIRYESLELLKEGKCFSVIEINGAGSEPTHMYSQGHSLFFAWKEILRHWNILCKISRMNHALGTPYMCRAEGMKMFRAYKEYNRLFGFIK